MRGLIARYSSDHNVLQLVLHYSADPSKDGDWVDLKRRGLLQYQWDREYEVDFTSRGGRLTFPMWDESIHVRLIHEGSSCLYRGIDHGRANPTACTWWKCFPGHGTAEWEGRIFPVDGDLYCYREYYEPGLTIARNASAIVKASGREEYIASVIDPSTNARLADQEHTIKKEYERWGLRPLRDADNSEAASIDRICSRLNAALARWSLVTGNKHRYFASTGAHWDVIEDWAKRPAMFVSPACPNLINEIRISRFEEHKNLVIEKNPKEKRAGFRDHAIDTARYVVNERPRFRRRPQGRPDPRSGAAIFDRMIRESERMASGGDGDLFSRSLTPNIPS